MAQTQIDCQFLRHLPLVVNEKEVRPVLRSRIIEHYDIASDAAWQVEEERGEGVAYATLSRGVARNRRSRAVEIKVATNTALVLDLQQEITIVPDLLTNLDRVITPDLGRDGRADISRLATIPRQTVDESKGRPRESVLDVDGRQSV